MKPILLNTEMVRAILDGRKTATRRVVKHPYYIDNEELCRASGYAMRCGDKDTDGMPYPDAPYEPGDILYVRETWTTTPNGQDYLFKADADGNAVKDRSGNWHVPKWRPSIHMPAEAARIFLRVTDVRVERLQEIDGAGAEAEGAIEINNTMIREDKVTFDAYGRKMFAVLWEATVGEAKRVKYGWAANPWVWVIEFERCGRPKEG